jgi:hypothetical protein
MFAHGRWYFFDEAREREIRPEGMMKASIGRRPWMDGREAAG